MLRNHHSDRWSEKLDKVAFGILKAVDETGHKNNRFEFEEGLNILNQLYFMAKDDPFGLIKISPNGEIEKFDGEYKSIFEPKEYDF